MTGPVVIAGGPAKRGCATRGNFAHPQSASGMAHSYSHRERFGAILAQYVVPVILRTVGALTALSRLHHNAKSVRNNSVGGKAPRSLSGGARVKPLQKSPRSVANRFQSKISFPDAPELHKQLTIGVFGNVRKAFGEFRNVQR